MHEALVHHRAAIAGLCRQFGVARLEAFGSAVSGSFEPARSDFDFIVRFAPAATPSLGRRFVGFGDALEALLGRRVDLIGDGPIENPYLRAAVQASRTVVHDESASEAPV